MNIKEVILAIAEEKPEAVMEAMDSIMLEKLSALVEERKQSIASRLFNEGPEDLEEEDDDFEEFDDDVEGEIESSEPVEEEEEPKENFKSDSEITDEKDISESILRKISRLATSRRDNASMVERMRGRFNKDIKSVHKQTPPGGRVDMDKIDAVTQKHLGHESGYLHRLGDEKGSMETDALKSRLEKRKRTFLTGKGKPASTGSEHIDNIFNKMLNKDYRKNMGNE